MINELQLTSDEALARIRKVLEQVNVAVATVQGEIVGEEEMGVEKGNLSTDDWRLVTNGGEYFQPVLGNVLFASAADGYGWEAK